jgi:hypothetical protein
MYVVSFGSHFECTFFETHSVVTKIVVKFTSGSTTASTKAIAQKQKTLTPQWNEELELKIDPADKLVIGM